MKLQRVSALIILLIAFLGFYLWRSQSRAFPKVPDASDNKIEPTHYDSPVHLADLEDRSINESSGIAASRRNANLLWSHNDSGDGLFIYGFDRQGKHRGVWRIAGASAMDWEDIAVGPGPKSCQSYIYIGDIGDNAKKRDEIVVYNSTRAPKKGRSYLLSSGRGSSASDERRLAVSADRDSPTQKSVM